MVPPADGPEVLRTDDTAGCGWMMVSGMVAWTVVIVLVFTLPLSVVTVSVAWIGIELKPPISWNSGFPTNSVGDGDSPLGQETSPFKVVE